MNDRAALANLIRRRKVSQALAKRARVVLACAELGATDLRVATGLGVTRLTVALWQQRLPPCIGWRAWLMGHVRECPRQIDDQAVERLIAPTLEEMPEQRHPL
ncbi:hypothetical protein [Geminicoccus roseus]|uniref:hypothetical protein n=1 Tax=Geminicoccus roseus TaxID=404900 RepID=UPI0012FA4E92|nr:hypothetical protein [Geminicoccus roseus]